MFQVLIPGQTDSQVNCKFAKPELAYGLATGGQTDSQVHASRKFHSYIVHLKSACVDLCTDLSLTKVHASQCKLVGGQMKCKLNASRKLGLTCESVGQDFSPSSEPKCACSDEGLMFETAKITLHSPYDPMFYSFHRPIIDHQFDLNL